MQASEPFDDLEFDPGRLLDHRYQMIALLGSGGMGRVFKAFHVMLDAPVALKEVRAPEDAPPDERARALNRFCREARLLTSLRHPNIPRVLDYFSEGSSCYLVMDYIEGTTLAGRLGAGQPPGERAPLPVDEALEYASQLCDVLIYLHDQQPAVVFGDLKPSNVILTPDGRAVMVDFGVARPASSLNETPAWMWGLESRGADSSSDTHPLGTPGYAAPEQYERGWRADPRSDIFALGVLLYEMVTGHAPPPFPFGFQPVRRLNPVLPGVLEALIERALCFNPDERFQSARAMAQALRLVTQSVAFQSAETQEMALPPGMLAAPAEQRQLLLVPGRRGRSVGQRPGAPTARRGLNGPRAMIPAPAARSHLHAAHLRHMLLTSAGAAGVMAAIAVGLLLYGLTSGNHSIAQTALNHPLAAAPTPTDTATMLPTETATTRPPTRSSPVSNRAPTPTATPNHPPTPTPTETPTPEPSVTPTETPSPTPTRTATPTGTPSPAPSGTSTPGPGPSPAPQGAPGLPTAQTSRPGTPPASLGGAWLVGLLAPLIAAALWLKRKAGG